MSDKKPLTEIQKWMENLVYMQLLRLGYMVCVGKIDSQEVGSLLDIGDNFPKYIVTLDDFALGTTREGIRIVHLRDFLLRENV